MFPWCILNLSLSFLFLLLLKSWFYLHWYLYSLFLFVAFFLLPYFALLYSLHLLYSAHLCLYFCTALLSILDTYLYLLKLSLRPQLSYSKLELHSSPSIYFFEFLYFLPFHTLLSNILTLLLIYLAILHWWQIGWCSFCMILLDVLLIHMHSRSLFPGVSWNSSTGFLYLFSFSFVLLFTLFVVSCVYINLLHIVLFCLASLLLVLLILLLLSKPFLYCLFSHVYLVLLSYFLLPHIFQVLFWVYVL